MYNISVVIPSQDGIHAKPLAYRLVDRHGYRSTAVKKLENTFSPSN